MVETMGGELQCSSLIFGKGVGWRRYWGGSGSVDGGWHFRPGSGDQGLHIFGGLYNIYSVYRERHKHQAGLGGAGGMAPPDLSVI